MNVAAQSSVAQKIIRPTICTPVQNGVEFGLEYAVKTDKIQSKDYKDEFKCVTKSALGDMFAFCTLCRSDVNIAHMVGCG